MIAANIPEEDMTVNTPEAQRDLLVKIFVPVFLGLGIALFAAYLWFPDSTTELMYKVAFSDWFKLWFGAFIGFVSAIVTYYFSKSQG